MALDKIYGIEKLLTEHAHVWHIDLRVSDSMLAQYRNLLSQRELVRADRFKYDRHRRRYTVGRAVLRIVLSHYLDENPKDISISYEDKGKPYLAKSNLQFNLSNSADAAVIGIMLNSQMGIDIEAVRHNVEFSELADRFFSNEEAAALRQSSDDTLADNFFRIWTRKEAFIKALGDGLTFPLKNFRVSFLEHEPAELLETKWDIAERKLWTLQKLTVQDGFHGAIAVKGQVNSLSNFEWQHASKNLNYTNCI